jgi:hypothetical protein
MRTGICSWIASENNIDVYMDTVTEFIRKCIGDVVPTVSIKTYPNQEHWINGSIRAKLKVRTTTFNHGKVTGNMVECKQLVIPSVRQSNRQNVSTETKWSHNSAAQTRDICGRVYRQSQITKGKPATSLTPSFPFLRITQCHRRGPLPRTVGSRSLWPM